MNYSLRKAAPKDAKILTALAVESKKYWGYPQGLIKLWLSELNVTPDFIKESISYVIEKDNRIIGFWARSAKEELSKGLFFIHPEFIGQGYGKILFKAVTAEAKNRNFKYLTWLADPNATKFYIKMGAVQISEQASDTVEGRILPVMRYYL